VVDDEHADSAHGNESARIVLAVPLGQARTFSPRRTRSLVVAWLLCLAGIVAIGVLARLPNVERPPASIVEAAGTRVAEIRLMPSGPPGPLAAVSSGEPVGVPGAAPTRRRTFGEDGLVGGIVFGDNVPRLSQADIERDGYRYYQELIARDLSAGRHGPP
jgi:hypothetical protein